MNKKLVYCGLTSKRFLVQIWTRAFLCGASIFSPMNLWVFYGYPDFLPQSKFMHLWLISTFKFSVSVSVHGRLTQLSPCLSCDRLGTCPRSTLPHFFNLNLIVCQKRKSQTFAGLNFSNIKFSMFSQIYKFPYYDTFLLYRKTIRNKEKDGEIWRNFKVWLNTSVFCVCCLCQSEWMKTELTETKRLIAINANEAFSYKLTGLFKPTLVGMNQLIWYNRIA